MRDFNKTARSYLGSELLALIEWNPELWNETDSRNYNTFKCPERKTRTPYILTGVILFLLIVFVLTEFEERLKDFVMRRSNRVTPFVN